MSNGASHAGQDEHGPYRLEESAPAAPRLPGNAIVAKDIEELHYALGLDLMAHAGNCVRAFGDFHLALSGGSTPLPFYQRLMIDPAFREFPWKRTHLWLVDERRVHPQDERCNWLHISELLVEHSDIPRSQAHPMAQLDDGADVRYENEIKEALAWREKGHDRLDFVLLGMGGDGHTASLFPGSPALSERQRLVVINAGPTVTPPDRVTMTYPLLNGARFIATLVTGAGKREALARVAAGDEQPRTLPIAGIRPVGGALRWYLDREACPEQDAPR
jgi:6-phosphogluconolactonase